MNTFIAPKLPPLPDVLKEHLSYFVEEKKKELTDAIEVYAIAAIQAQDNSNGVVVSQAVPDGWQLVPIEPTEAMRYAGGAALGGMSPNLEDADTAYCAMLASAPPAPQASVVQQEPIYQLQLASGAWIDQSEQSYKYNLKNSSDRLRVVYTHPAQQAKPQDSTNGVGALQPLSDALDALFSNIEHAISSGAWNVQKGSQTWEIIQEVKAAHGIKE